MENKLFTNRDLVRIAVMSALTVVCSWITVHIPVISVPFTLQTFAVFFALEFIGGRNGTISFFVYILLGALGVPVFSGFNGGFGHLFGPTGGYLIGFVLSCLIYWAFEKRFGYKSAFHYVVLAASLIACYICGTVWFSLYTNTPFITSLSVCVVPFIVPDVLKIALAVLLSVRLRKIIKI